MQTHFQASVTLFEITGEKNHKVQKSFDIETSDCSPGISKGSYGSLNVGLQKQSYFVYALHG
jgi:hypothetical protein